MKQFLQELRRQRFAWLLIALPMLSVAMCSVTISSWAEDVPASRDRFIELDSELQGIREEILAINRDMRVLEEMALYPPAQQIVVLVSVAPNSELTPGRITLAIDDLVATRHDYNERESAALLGGGVHRLYVGSLSDGEHRFEVTLSGQRTRSKPFTQRSSTIIQKAPGRKYVELHLAPGKRKSQPALTIAEWQR